jgi:hypothetical protein
MVDGLALNAARAVPQTRQRIVWLAVAEGRGHLMRAALAAQLLAPAGIEVDLVTTNEAGVAFAAELGLAASLLSTSYRLVYDDRQNVALMRCRAMAMTYLLSPNRCLRDLAWLEGRAHGAALVVNDSFHPALLTSSLLGKGLARRVVHLHGENTRSAVEDSAGRGPMRALIRRALGNSPSIEIKIDGASGGGDRVIQLPPLLPVPGDRDRVRAARGIAPGRRLAVVYLTRYFHDSALAEVLERELGAAGFAIHAVGEGYAGRPGWLARDAGLPQLAAAADVFVSAAGAGAVALARGAGVPMIALATDQPEQRKNLESDRGGAWRTAIDLRARGAALAADLRAAISAIPPAAHGASELAVRRARAQWLAALTALVERNRT